MRTLVMQYHQITIRELADEADINTGSIYFIIEEALCFRRIILAEFVPKLLAVELKKFWMEITLRVTSNCFHLIIVKLYTKTDAVVLFKFFHNLSKTKLQNSTHSHILSHWWSAIDWQLLQVGLNSHMCIRVAYICAPHPVSLYLV